MFLPLWKMRFMVNLGSMATTLWSFVDYEPLKMLRVYEGTCIWVCHVWNLLICIHDDNVFARLTLVNMKDV
jgi:hypothetical protein